LRFGLMSLQTWLSLSYLQCNLISNEILCQYVYFYHEISWNIRFFVNAMADELSIFISVNFSYSIHNSFNNLLSHMKWKTHDVVAIYLASYVDKVTIDCFFELYVNVVSPI